MIELKRGLIECKMPDVCETLENQPRKGCASIQTEKYMKIKDIKRKLSKLKKEKDCDFLTNFQVLNETSPSRTFSTGTRKLTTKSFNFILEFFRATQILLSMSLLNTPKLYSHDNKCTNKNENGIEQRDSRWKWADSEKGERRQHQTLLLKKKNLLVSFWELFTKHDNVSFFFLESRLGFLKL